MQLQQITTSIFRNFKGVKVAFIKDLGLPWQKEVKDAVDAQRKVFESLGCIVEENEPDMADADECFNKFRHWQIEVQYGDLLAANSNKLNNYTKWHIAEAGKLNRTLPVTPRGKAVSSLQAHAKIFGTI